MMIFRLFSLLFAYPSTEVIRSINKLLENKPMNEPECVQMINSMNITDLQTEYTRLFVSSYPTLLCPPYESFYREGTIYGDTINRVTAIYNRYKLTYVYEGEPPDHISVELDFLAETGDQSFRERMWEWVPDFTARVKKSSNSYDLIARELEDLFIE